MTVDHRRLTLRRLAWAGVLLMLVVTSASAWLRLAQPRPACVDWPACRDAGRPVARAVAAAALGEPRVLALVRGVHRVAATVMLLLALALAALALARPPRQWAVGRYGLALLVLALALSALGIFTPGSKASGILVGNLLGGLLMLGLSWRLAGHLSGRPGSGRVLARWAGVGAGLWAVQAVLGVVSGAGPSDALPSLAVVHVAHVALGLLAASCAGGVGWAARQQGRRREGAGLLALAALQFLLGAAAASFGAAPAIVLLHNLGAAIGLALLLGLAVRQTTDTPTIANV